MQFSDDILVRIAVFVLAVCGFFVAKYIYNHKKPNQKPLVCPVGFDCNAVVNGEYSRFIGVPIEIFGMIYYALVSMVYLFLIFLPTALPDTLIAVMILRNDTHQTFSINLGKTF